MLRRFEALGRQKPDHLDGILISHRTPDHSNGLGQLQREWKCLHFLPSHTSRGSSRCSKIRASRRRSITCSTCIPARNSEIGDIEVTPFAIPHDASDPVGYCFKANGIKVAIVTDLGYLPELRETPSARS
jgi:phosphoribosyl 1,2-cyclic phosphodiesterase